jgi:hypothetical protein
MEHFSFHSEQIHSQYNDGKGKTMRNIVDIQNGKGMKAVETYTVDGKRTSRKEKELTAKELECIQKHQFIPGLFQDCISPMRKRTKTRRRTPK